MTNIASRLRGYADMYDHTHLTRQAADQIDVLCAGTPEVVRFQVDGYPLPQITLQFQSDDQLRAFMVALS
jgi:hypothetical protein